MSDPILEQQAQQYSDPMQYVVNQTLPLSDQVGLWFSNNGFGSLGSSLSTIGNGLSNFFGTQLGSGDNATTYGQLGLGLIGGLYNNRQQKKALNSQLDFGYAQLGQNKAFGQANWMDQLQNRNELSAMQLQGLAGFNPAAAAERARNLAAATAGIDRAGANIGINNASEASGLNNILRGYNALA